MIKIENTEVVGWEAAVRGMRNPMNSWDKSDSGYCHRDLMRDCTTCVHHSTGYSACAAGGFDVGPKDYGLMTRLRNAGTDHRKFMRMITVYVDITAPLYWWKEFKTYRAGKRFGDDEPSIVDEGYLEYDIEMNSCSTMHKIAEKEFTLEDFSCEHLLSFTSEGDERKIPFVNIDPYTECGNMFSPKGVLELIIIPILNHCRDRFLKTKDKKYWWQMIQLLPSSYNQKRTVMLNYEVLANIYKSRYNHRLDEWSEFRNWIESLPYSELITGKEKEPTFSDYISTGTYHSGK